MVPPSDGVTLILSNEFFGATMQTPVKSTKPAPAGRPAGSHPGVSVWLIEDNHMFRKTVARVLGAQEGMECSQAFANAEDALDALRGGAVPDVILVDVELPGLNGIDAVKTIKSITPASRVVMLTAFDDPDKIFRAICAGASGYLLKTAPIERIVEAIYEALNGGAPLNPQVAQSVLKMFAGLVQPTCDYGLTEREQRILELMTQGLIKKEIADQLGLSYHTVDTHLRNIYTKLHVHSRTGAVAKALKERLFRPTHAPEARR
ncbi:MAG TPA: response regulator transcription factor [Verrucomicrobiota bacterium]|nr:response regulator transcription factor [Verrucomicrobiota bacterium]